MDQKNKVDWLSLPFELWDYIVRYHVVDEYDALRLAQTCSTLWEVYKSNGVKQWAWGNRWIRDVEQTKWGDNWKGAMRWSDDKKERVWRSLYDNGELHWEEHWVDGKKHGLARGWCGNGQLRREEHWVDGKLHGLARGWHYNGKLWWEEHWVDGKKHGLRRQFLSNGKLAWETHWVHGINVDALYMRVPKKMENR